MVRAGSSPKGPHASVHVWPAVVSMHGGLGTVSGCLGAAVAESSRCSETAWPTEPRTRTVWPFMDIVCRPTLGAGAAVGERKQKVGRGRSSGLRRVRGCGSCTLLDPGLLVYHLLICRQGGGSSLTPVPKSVVCERDHP